MKTRLNPRKKYAAGTSALGMNPAHYIISPAEAMNDYNIMMAGAENAAVNNPWAPYVTAIGAGVSKFLGGSASLLTNKGGGDEGDAVDKKDTENAETKKEANGDRYVDSDVEVEGGEMYETPDGITGTFKGPSHAQGGIPLEVVSPLDILKQYALGTGPEGMQGIEETGEIKEGTKIYSVDLKIGDETLAERKQTRINKTEKLEKIASQPLVDQAIKNSTKRKMMAIQKEEAADLNFQDKVNDMKQMADNVVAAFGTSAAGLQDNPVGDSMRYATGTNAMGVTEYALGGIVDPIYGNEDNKNKNFQSFLGVTPDGILGKKTQAAWDNYLTKTSPEDYKKSNYYFPGESKDPKDFNEAEWYPKMGLTPGGRQFKKPLDMTPAGATELINTKSSSDVTKDLEQSMARDAFSKDFKATQMAEEDAAFYTPGQVGVAKTTDTADTEKPGILSKVMGSLPTLGDATKLFGNFLGMTSGIDTATEQRASDITHTNVYEHAGEDSQRMLDNAKQGIEISKAQAIVKANANTRTGRKGARNSARGVNQMRGMDWLYDTALNQQIADITAGAAEKMSGIDIQKSGVAFNADQLKGTGKYQAEMANEAAKDAYYTALALGRKDYATGMQQSGKDLNDMKQNKVIENLMKQYGKYFKGDETGISNKDVVSTDKKATIHTVNGIKYKEDANGNLIKTA